MIERWARRLCRLFHAAVLTLCVAGSSVAAQELRPYPIDPHAPYRASDYAPIVSAMGDAPMVALGESIHLTREMPLVRLQLLRRLNEARGVDALALEGSLLDSWTAQEHAYRSNAPLAERTRTFAREALFGLWQTDEMEKVIAYALSTQRGPRPIYLTSFDLQPGTARAYNGSSQRSMDAFVAALRALYPGLDARRAQGWSRALGRALGCEGALDQERAALDLEAWMASDAAAAPAVARPSAHLAALKMVPEMIRGRLRHCRDVRAPGHPADAYQRGRDVLNAKLARSLLRQIPRMVLWAHHSHLTYNSLGRLTPSMGQHLKAVLGDRLYSVGVFASGGMAVDSLRLDSASGAGIIAALAARRLPGGDRYGVESKLARLSGHDFFVNLRSAPAEWNEPNFSRAELALRMPTALASDYDGAILLHTVSGAELNFVPAPVRTLARLAGWCLAHPILASMAAAALLLALAVGLRAAWRRLGAARARRAASAT